MCGAVALVAARPFDADCPSRVIAAIDERVEARIRRAHDLPLDDSEDEVATCYRSANSVKYIAPFPTCAAHRAMYSESPV